MATAKKLPPSETQNGARILSLLHRVDTWDALCEMFEFADHKNHKTNTISRTLYFHLAELRRLGLIEYKANVEAESDIKGRIEITAQWADIQKALGRQPLAGIADISAMSAGMAVKPLFGTPRHVENPIDLFVLMPFRAELKPIYDKIIKKVAKKVGITVRRGDDIFSAHNVMADIWADICSARAILADCTGRNPNVFYEIGLAHIVGKNVIFTAQSEKDIPFDIQHIRFIEYKNSVDGIPKFEQQLAATLKEALNPGP
jgi:hypothetical protein